MTKILILGSEGRGARLALAALAVLTGLAAQSAVVEEAPTQQDRALDGLSLRQDFGDAVLKSCYADVPHIGGAFSLLHSWQYTDAIAPNTSGAVKSVHHQPQGMSVKAPRPEQKPSGYG